jgi:hypothetical protein
MDLLKLLLDSQNSPALKQLAANFGVSENQAKSAISGMAPAFSQGLRKNMSSPDGLEGLMNALSKGDHQRYVDHPETLATATTDGNAILSHLFGSKDTSRAVASDVASRTGLDNGLLKKMLPAVAAMVMGAMSKQGNASGLTSAVSGGGDSSGMLGMLSGLLDADKDGSVVDDVMKMAGKFMR